MKIKFLLFFILSTICFSQNQEIQSAKKHFENDYALMNIQRSELEPIKLKENKYLIGKDTLYIKNDSISKLLTINKIFNHFLSKNSEQSNSISLTGLKLIDENANKKIRRFQIYRNTKCNPKIVEVCLSNPVIYYFEVSSNCINCDDFDFFNNSKLTYLKKGGIML